MKSTSFNVGDIVQCIGYSWASKLPHIIVKIEQGIYSNEQIWTYELNNSEYTDLSWSGPEQLKHIFPIIDNKIACEKLNYLFDKHRIDNLTYIEILVRLKEYETQRITESV
jgi:hypothetical protein